MKNNRVFFFFFPKIGLKLNPYHKRNKSEQPTAHYLNLPEFA